MTLATFGISHVAVAVADLDRAADFYAKAFGATVYSRHDDQVQLTGPGPRDIIACDLDPVRAGKIGGVAHFGIRLKAPRDIDAAVAAVVAAGGTLKTRGDWGPAEPYAFVRDPDGNEIELWYEDTPPHAQD